MSTKHSSRNSLKFLSLAFGITLLASNYASAQADSLTISGSLSSEQINLGLSEANGRPGLGLAIEWEASRNFFVGGSVYQTTDAPAPNRPQNLTAYAGLHWGSSDSLQYDLTLIYRAYPGDFSIDWDYPELRFNLGFTSKLGLALSAAEDFYGLDVSNVAAIGEYVHDFSAKFYSRVEGGYVHFDGSAIESYGYVILTAGMRGDRWSIEGGYRANNAEPFPAFRGSQLDDRFMISANWLFY